MSGDLIGGLWSNPLFAIDKAVNCICIPSPVMDLKGKWTGAMEERESSVQQAS